MEQLDNLIYDATSSLRSNKKQRNKNAIYYLISSNLESLSKEQLKERLNCLFMRENLKTNHTTEKALVIWKLIEPICCPLSKLTSYTNY